MQIDRRSFLELTSATVASLAASRYAVGADSGAPLPIGNENQLFVDDFVIDRQAGLKRSLHQPKKQGLIKEADGRDWQRGGVYVGKTVCQDNVGKFHMTYRHYWWDAELQKLPQIGIDKAHWFHETVGYATSDDGIHWAKPNLGLVEAPAKLTPSNSFPFETPEGVSRNNNLGYPIFFATDLHAHGNITDPNKRFLLQYADAWSGDDPFAKPIGGQLCFAADWPDITDPNWKQKLTPIVGGKLSPRGLGFPMVTGFDHQTNEWFMTCQDVIGSWLKRNGRDVARCATPDLVSWTGPTPTLQVADDESRTSKDYVEYMDLWSHRVGGTKTGAWLGQLWIFHSDRSSPEYQMPTIPNVWRKGTTEIRLVISRDAGKTWQRVCDRDVWMPHHESEDGYDHLPCCSVPVRVKDELRFYYACWNGEHLVFYRDGTPYYSNRMRNSSTAWATLRVDGHVSLDAGNQPGHLVTHPIRFEGGQLRVNAKVPNGVVRVEVQEESGQPIVGFSLDDCRPVTGDSIRQSIAWKANPDVRSLAGRVIRLKFELQQGELYSFQFA